MAEQIIVYWRDIPAQIILKQGRKTAKRQLPERFQEAIDRAAMRGGLAGSDAYLEAWRRQTNSVESTDLDMTAAHLAAALDEAFSDARLQSIVRQAGHDLDQSNHARGPSP